MITYLFKFNYPGHYNMQEWKQDFFDRASEVFQASQNT